MKMYRASKNDNLLIIVDAHKITNNFLFFKDRVYERKEAIVGINHRYFDDEREAIIQLKDWANEDLQHKKKALFLAQVKIQELNDLYPE